LIGGIFLNNSYFDMAYFQNIATAHAQRYDPWIRSVPIRGNPASNGFGLECGM